MTMREKIARALMVRDHRSETPSVADYANADAALDALREPTSGMFDAAKPHMDSWSSNRAWWDKMIQAARDGK